MRIVAAMLVFGVCAVAHAEHPCAPKTEAKHAAHKALNACVEAWAKDRKPTEADPTEDCTAQLNAFLAAAKDVKACHTANPK